MLYTLVVMFSSFWLYNNEYFILEKHHELWFHPLMCAYVSTNVSTDIYYEKITQNL